MGKRKKGGNKHMSKDEMEGAMKVTFNFSELQKTMADMKSSVWRMDKVDE